MEANRNPYQSVVSESQTVRQKNNATKNGLALSKAEAVGRNSSEYVTYDPTRLEYLVDVYPQSSWSYSEEMEKEKYFFETVSTFVATSHTIASKLKTRFKPKSGIIDYLDDLCVELENHINCFIIRRMLSAILKATPDKVCKHALLPPLENWLIGSQTSLKPAGFLRLEKQIQFALDIFLAVTGWYEIVLNKPFLGIHQKCPESVNDFFDKLGCEIIGNKFTFSDSSYSIKIAYLRSHPDPPSSDYLLPRFLYEDAIGNSCLL